MYYSYTSVFNEYTTVDARKACSNYANCYIGCTCAAGWEGKKTYSAAENEPVETGSIDVKSTDNKLKSAGKYQATAKSTDVSNVSAKAALPEISTMAAGDSCSVTVTDPRYGTPCSKRSVIDCNGVCDGSAYFRCVTGSTSSSCSSGYYSVYEGRQKCTSGLATNSTSCYTCHKCTYTCSYGYSTSTTSCGSGKYLVTENANKADSSCPAKTCGKCNTCTYSTSYFAPSGYQESVSCGSGYDKVSKQGTCSVSANQSASTCASAKPSCSPKTYYKCESVSCPDGYYTGSTCSGGTYTNCSTTPSDYYAGSDRCYSRTYSCKIGYLDEPKSGADCTAYNENGKTCYRCTVQLVDPCKGQCGKNQVHKTWGMQSCCCPNSDSLQRECNCCGVCPVGQYYYKNEKGEDCCCTDLDHVGGSGPGGIQQPTSCYCFSTGI